MYIFRVRNAPNMTANPIFLVPSLVTVKPCSFNKFSQYHRSKTTPMLPQDGKQPAQTARKHLQILRRAMDA